VQTVVHEAAAGVPGVPRRAWYGGVGDPGVGTYHLAYMSSRAHDEIW